MVRWMKHLFTVPGTRSTELATFEPLSHSDHAKAITESLFSLALPAYKGLIEQIAILLGDSQGQKSTCADDRWFW